MATDAAAKPDIILFMVDQLSARWLERGEEGLFPTPNIDALKKRGVTFRNAYTSNPVCCPTRATMATGLTTRGHGVLENGYYLDPELPTFMQVLQADGWRTGLFGKGHFRPHFAGLYPDYGPYGFDVTHVTEDPRGGEWLDWVLQHHPEHAEAALATIWATRVPDFESYGPEGTNLRRRIETIRVEFEWATPAFPQNTAFAHTLPFPEEVSQTAWITRHALDFLANGSSDRPLFAQISYVQPHSPFCPPAEFMEHVAADAIPEPAPAEWASDPHAPAYFDDKEPHRPDTWRHARHCYFADIVHLDAQLGRVMSALEEQGRLENTYMLFLSDHGELLFDHGFVSKEERHYDACIRVPLMVAGPGVQAGETTHAFAQLEDICPTILDMAGAELPPMPRQGPYLRIQEEELPRCAGQSLLPVLEGRAETTGRAHAYVESYNPIWSAHPGDWARTVRTERYRYTYFPNGNGEQLFDVASDPDEQRNLAADPDHQELKHELRRRLLEETILQDHPKTRRGLYALGVH